MCYCDPTIRTPFCKSAVCKMAKANNLKAQQIIFHQPKPMPKRDVKVGDRFQLFGENWVVRMTIQNSKPPEKDIFQARLADRPNLQFFLLEVEIERADLFDWIDPPFQKLTKEQAEMIKKGNRVKPGGITYLIDSDYLDSITE